MKWHDRKGFSLIELVVTSSVIAIIAVVTSGIVITLMQLLIYIPSEMKAVSIANEVIRTVLEGEPARHGMRYAAQIQ
ncbi:MAG: type II secretion system protein, partial [Candidatus Omnitrophota bacterium]|nr:type II secretion system protein [Candidatus Omnitrophota bacterium]